MDVRTKPKVRSDVLKWCNHDAFCLVSAVIKNTDPNSSPPARSISEVVGMPVKGTYDPATKVLELAYATEEASVTGVIVGGPPIKDLADNATTTEKYLVLSRGPALLNDPEDGLADADPAGDDFTKATILTALASRDIRPMEFPETYEQSS